MHRRGRTLKLAGAAGVIAVILTVVLSLPRPSTAGSGPDTANAKAAPPYGTMSFDNTRFFSPKAGEDWVRISATGTRIQSTAILPARSALVVVDLQKRICQGWGNSLAKVDKSVGDAYTARMNQVVLPNVARLLALFRQHDLPIAFLTLGVDDVDERIAPAPERLTRNREFLVRKYAPGPFSTSALDNILREQGVATLFIVGTDTAGCVLATLSGAHDRTYQTILIEDAAVSGRPELHDAVVKIWNYNGFVRSTRQVIDDFPWKNWVNPALLSSR